MRLGCGLDNVEIGTCSTEEAKGVSLLHIFQAEPMTNSTFYLMDIGGFLTMIRRQGLEANHLSPGSTKVTCVHGRIFN
jgi:hypothetical protein